MKKERFKRPKCRLIANESVKNFPWLIRLRKRRIVWTRWLSQVGHPFRLWTINAMRPATAAVFYCHACGECAIAIISNVLADKDSTCGCIRTIHGRATGDNSLLYHRWQHLLTRHKKGEPVQDEWLNPATGVLAFAADVGELPGQDFYLCRRVGKVGWLKGNTYWQRSLHGVWATTSDDGWQMVSGQLRQVGKQMKVPGRPAVFHCSGCDRNIIESREKIMKHKYHVCTDCREPGRIIEWKGKRQTVAEWAKEVGLPAMVIYDRLRYGWSVERMLTQPQRAYRLGGNGSNGMALASVRGSRGARERG